MIIILMREILKIYFISHDVWYSLQISKFSPHIAVYSWWLSYNTWCSRREKDGLLGLRGLKSGDLVIVNISVFFFLNGNYQIIMLDYFSYFRLWNWGCILQIHFFTSWHACYSIWARCRNDSLHYTAGELQTGCMMKFIGPNFYWILKGSSIRRLW